MYELISLVRCARPDCAGKLELAQSSSNRILACTRCHARYPFLDNIPLIFFPPEVYLSTAQTMYQKSNERWHALVDGVDAADSHCKMARQWLERLAEYEREAAKAAAELSRSYSEDKSPNDAYIPAYVPEQITDAEIFSSYGVYLKQRTHGQDEGYFSCLVSLGKSISPNSKVLEIGCGTGRTVLDYADLVPHGFVVGLDQTYSKLFQARRLVLGTERVTIVTKQSFDFQTVSLEGMGKSNAGVIAGRVDALPLHDSTFDCVILTYVRGHIPEPTAMLHEAARVLQEGGTLIIAHGFSWGDVRPKQVRTSPGWLHSELKAMGMVTEIEFDFPRTEVFNDRLARRHLIRFVRTRKGEQ